MDRRADGGPGEDSKERAVRAAYAIVTIDGRNRAHHPFQHLVAELALATRHFSALARLAIASLRFPNSSRRDQQTRQYRNRCPDFDGTGGGVCQILTLLQDLLLLVCIAANQLVEFAVSALKLNKSLKVIVLCVFCCLEIHRQIAVESPPIRQLRKRRMIEERN